MKKIILLSLCVMLLFTSCVQKQLPNEENTVSPTATNVSSPNRTIMFSATPIPTRVPTPTPTAKPIATIPPDETDYFGFSTQVIIKDDGTVKSTFMGLETSHRFIDEKSIIVHGKDLDTLYSEGYFDDFTCTIYDVDIKSIKKCNVYLLTDSTVIKGSIDKIDIFFSEGSCHYYIKISSSFEDKIPEVTTDEFLCVLSEKDIDIEIINRESNDDLLNSLLEKIVFPDDEKFSASLLKEIIVDGETYFYLHFDWGHSELYGIYDYRGAHMFELWFSEP